VLDEHHAREVKPRIDPSLDESSMVVYLLRPLALGLHRPAAKDVAAAEKAAPLGGAPALAAREIRWAEAERAAELAPTRGASDADVAPTQAA
jgi:hypothetical protein